MKKLQNSFNVFLPQNYREFKQGIVSLNSNQAVVAELLRICCEEDDVKAIKIAFERILGKPEKVVQIKKTTIRTIYPDATKKSPTRVIEEETFVRNPLADMVVVDEGEVPGKILYDMLDKIGEKGRGYAYEVLQTKNNYSVTEVMVSNLYAIAMRGANLAAITMLFDYLDGAIADVIRLEGEDTLVLDNYADVAPYEAVQGSDGIYYIEVESNV